MERRLFRWYGAQYDLVTGDMFALTDADFTMAYCIQGCKMYGEVEGRAEVDLTAQLTEPRASLLRGLSLNDLLNGFKIDLITLRLLSK